jgi:hypothetical protein
VVRKWRALQLFCFRVRIYCRDNVSAEQLPSSDRWMHIQTHRLMGAIYKVRRWVHVPWYIYPVKKSSP